MPVQPGPGDPQFEPRQRAGRRREAVYLVVCAVLWALALGVTAFVAFDTDAVALGLAVAMVSFLVAALLLVAAVYLRAWHARHAPSVSTRPSEAARV